MEDFREHLHGFYEKAIFWIICFPQIYRADARNVRVPIPLLRICVESFSLNSFFTYRRRLCCCLQLYMIKRLGSKLCPYWRNFLSKDICFIVNLAKSVHLLSSFSDSGTWGSFCYRCCSWPSWYGRSWTSLEVTVLYYYWKTEKNWIVSCIDLLRIISMSWSPIADPLWNIALLYDRLIYFLIVRC